MKLIFLSAIILFILSNQLFANEINFLAYNTNGKIFTDENEELRGKRNTGRQAFDFELVREMMIMLNHPKNFYAITFKRGLEFVQTKSDFALLNVTRKEEREHTVKWVGPIEEDLTSFYELKDNPTHIKTLEDAKKVKNICVLKDGYYDIFLKNNYFNNLIQANSYSECFTLLKQKKVSLLTSSKLLNPYRIKDSNINEENIQQTPVFLFQTKSYLGFSKNISDEVIQNWQNALDKIKQSKKYDELVKNYLLVK